MRVLLLSRFIRLSEFYDAICIATNSNIIMLHTNTRFSICEFQLDHLRVICRLPDFAANMTIVWISAYDFLFFSIKLHSLIDIYARSKFTSPWLASVQCNFLYNWPWNCIRTNTLWNYRANQVCKAFKSAMNQPTQEIASRNSYLMLRHKTLARYVCVYVC